jgi:hypothetical protein
MSKKSRRRNKALLTIAGLAGAAALANRKPKQSSTEEDSGNRGDGPAAIARRNANKTTTAKKKSEPKKVYQDDIMRGGSGVKDNSPKNPYSIRTDKTPIKFGLGAQKGYTKTSIPKATTTIQDNMPAEPKGNTATGSVDFNDKIRANNERIKSGLKSGGRAGYKHGGSTGSSKSYGAAKRGISPILMKGRK